MFLSIGKWLKYTLAHTQARLVLILTVSVFMIILAVSLTSYYTSKSVLQEELSEPQHQMLQISMKYIDDLIRESDKIAVQVAVNDDIYDFLTSENQNSVSNISTLYRLLSTWISNSKYINSIYVYDVERGSFISLPQGYSSSKLTFVDSEWTGIADEFGDDMMMIRKRHVPEGAGNKGSELTLFRKIMIQSRLRGVVAVNLLDAELFAKLNPPALSQLDSMRYIVDQHNNILYSVSNSEFQPEAVKQALHELKEDHFGDFSHEGRKLLVNQIESPLTGWKYVSIVSQDSLLAQSKKVRDTVLYVSVAALALGVLTILYVNSAAFRPVRRLKQLFSAYNGKATSPDRIDLEKLAGELLSNHAHLSQLIRETISDAASKFLYDIHSGHMSGRREIREKWRRYFAEWTDAPVTVAVLSIDRYDSWSRRFPASDHSLLKFALANIMAELHEPEWRVACADFGADRMAILFQPRSGETRPPLAEAIETVSRLLKFSVSAGVSMPQSEVCRLKQAMLEAENALTYRLYKGYGQLVPFQDVSSHEVTDMQPQEDGVRELMTAVETGEGERAIELLGRIIGDIRSRYWYPSEALALLQALLERLKGICPEGEGPEGDPAGRLGTLYIEDIEAELSGLISVLADRYRRLIGSKDFLMCQRMIEFMEQHLGDPIGIPEIAESTGISSSLASQLFKQETNETIYNYLTRLRMERASELLVKTDRKISDIAQMVGYQHENSFIRSFRKFKDITPGKYRDMMRTRIDALFE